MLCAHGRAGQTQLLFFLRRILQSKIRNSAAAESEGGQKFLPPNPLPFCPPERFSFAREARNHSGFCSKNVRTSSKKHRQVLHSAKLKDVASALRASAWYFPARIQAFLRGNESVRSAMRKFLCEAQRKWNFQNQSFFFRLWRKVQRYFIAQKRYE